MATLRELKGRIGSVASTGKITGAMKMISSAKMHKAEMALRRLKPFRDNIESIIGNLLSSDATFYSPLTDCRDVRRVTVVILGSDDGLCGAYNVNIFKAMLEHLRQLRSSFGDDLQIEIIPVGRKMLKVASKIADRGTVVTQASGGINSKSDGAAVKGFVQGLESKFLAGETDRVDVVYMNYLSAGRQVLEINQVLPLRADTFTKAGEKASVKPYIFEPDAQTIFSTVLPMFLLAMMQDVFSENRASEQAARVMAMQSANDNAKKLLEQLQLEYNKLRQQSITTELLDIVGGQVRD